MFAKLLPRRCSTLSVFVSYASEQRALGEEIAQALKNAGHDVFFDLDSIPASGEYNDRIRSAIEDSDRFVFLASREALVPGRFTLTELEFAKQRWPLPAGNVIPVLVDKRMAVNELPIYLRSISVLTIHGNAVAEIVSAVQKTRKIGRLCKSVTLAGASAAALAVGYGGAGLGMLSRSTDIVLVPPQAIHFRPAVDAPFRPTEASATPNWAASPLTVTVMPVAYTHRTEPGRRARILREAVDVSIGGAVQSYRAAYVVEITDAPCGERWFCIKGNVGVETLEPGASINRETMFGPVSPHATSWRQFVDDLLAKPGVPITVTFHSSVEVSEDSGLRRIELRSDCGIDVEQMREQVAKAGFVAGGDVKPAHIEMDCLLLPSPVGTSTPTRSVSTSMPVAPGGKP